VFFLQKSIQIESIQVSNPNFKQKPRIDFSFSKPVRNTNNIQKTTIKKIKVREEVIIKSEFELFNNFIFSIKEDSVLYKKNYNNYIKD
jgi:hypothetical protein